MITDNLGRKTSAKEKAKEFLRHTLDNITVDAFQAACPDEYEAMTGRELDIFTTQLNRIKERVGRGLEVRELKAHQPAAA